MKRNLLLTFLSLLIHIHPSAAKEQYIFTQITSEEELSSTIDGIYKETDGDVWISTRKGLYRFNGNALHHYEDSLLIGRRVTQVNIDKHGNLWVLTDNWIFCREAGDKHFKRISPVGDVPKRTIYSMCCDEDYVWFGASDKIYRYSYSENRLKLFCNLKGDNHFVFWQMNLLADDTILCCSHDGILLIDRQTGKISQRPFGSRREVSSAMVDSRGYVWIAFYNRGIEVYSQDNVLVKKYTTENSDLSHNVVLCMTERDSIIWAGTDGGGINVIDPSTDRIKILSHIPGDPSSLPAQSIKSLYTDKDGNVWVGSIRNGLICISQSKMNTYTDVHIGLRHGLSNSTVLFLYQEPGSQDIWIGTDGEGVNLFDPETNKFTHFPATLKTKVVSIATYSPTELLLSLYADGIYIFNKNTGALKPLEIKDEELNYQIRYSGRSINLLNEGKDGFILYGNKMKRYDRKTGNCTIVPFEDSSKAGKNLSYAGQTPMGHWFHNSNHILLLPKDGTHISVVGENHRHEIRCAQIDSQGIMWLATDEGLCRFCTKTLSFNHLETKVIREADNVVCDNRGRVWVGSHSHLSAYLTDGKNFALFGESDGVKSNEFLSTAKLLSSNGDVYMGGVHGLLKIDHDYEIDATEVPSLGLYALLVDTHLVDKDKNGIYRIPRNSHSMRISISAQEKDLLRKKMYRFMFSGTNEEYVTEQPELMLRKLPNPGTYDVYLACTKRNGEWSQPIRLMTMTVPQPWYLTWWFLAISAFISLLITTMVAVYLHQRKTDNMRLRLKEQEQKIYEEKVGLLINVSHELRTPLTLILAPLKRLLKKMSPGDENFSTLNRIYRQSGRMKDLLNMVLDLRKMEEGKDHLKINRIDYNKWLCDTIEDIANEELAEGITIVTELDPAVGMVDFDKQKCDTVLMNVLMNAVKHSSSGDRIVIRTSLKDGFVKTSISDQGPGLSNIDPSQMFTRFYQSNNEQYGSGIGLSYSRILVELHGGSIGAADNEDKGATFWWEIPVLQSSEDKIAPPKAYLNELMGAGQDVEIDMLESDGFNTSGMTLMLIDDNIDLLDFLREALQGEFKKIITLTGGNPALRMLNSGKLPDIIVSDINMPDGDGYTLCRQIKNNSRISHIPVILLTARGEEKSQSDSYRLGAEGFIPKPFEIETLMEAIRGLLKSKAEIRRKYLDTKEKSQADYGSNEEAFIIRFNSIIAEHLSDPALDQNMLCKELGVSRALLYNKVKAVTGTGAKEYINKIRIEKAKTLIETTGLSIAEIAEMTGFSGQSYFSTAFKSYTGLTPSQYKKESGNQ